MFRFLFHLFCFNDFDRLVGVELDEFRIEIGCEHHMSVNMHQRKIEKQISLNFSNCMIFWEVQGNCCIWHFGYLLVLVRSRFYHLG